MILLCPKEQCGWKSPTYAYIGHAGIDKDFICSYDLEGKRSGKNAVINLKETDVARDVTGKFDLRFLFKERQTNVQGKQRCVTKNRR